MTIKINELTYKFIEGFKSYPIKRILVQNRGEAQTKSLGQKTFLRWPLIEIKEIVIQVLRRLSTSVLIVIVSLAWPCYALDNETSINQKPANNEKGPNAEAIPDYSEAIKLKPEHADFYYSRGLAYNKMGRYDEAISDYTQAIKRKPKHADLYYSRGLAYNKMGRYDEAVSDYTQAIKLKPKHADFYYSRGVAYNKMGKSDKAISDYTKAIALKHKHADTDL
jgi:tetratricopeptide (TPR) repeat protein